MMLMTSGAPLSKAYELPLSLLIAGIKRGTDFDNMMLSTVDF
jgi:hypothetical protein